MKYNFIKSIAVAALVATSLTGCINDDDYGVPNADCIEENLAANKTVAQVFAAAPNVLSSYTAAQIEPLRYTADDVIEGYVVSNDERGNFFKTVYLQTHPTDGSAPVGFSVAIDKNTLFGANFVPGRKVYVKLKGLFAVKQYDALAIGDMYVNNELSPSEPAATFSFGRMPEYKYANFVIAGCSEVSEDELARPLTLAQAVTNANLNTLIDLQNVQFADGEPGLTYYDADNDIGGATNRTLTSGSNTLIFRFSSFANFSSKLIPSGSGTVRGVLTKYGSDFQFMVREESDIQLDQPRIDSAPPIVPGTLTYGLYNETFESYAANNQIFPNAINDAAVGSRYWQVKTFGGNKYIQMSSFGGTAEANRALFIVPVDFTAASILNFQSKDGYNDGAVLKVYYSTNYTPGGDINAATLTDITSTFAIATGSTSGYATNFTNSGNYNIPASLTGNGYFIFEYTGNGNGGPTTTMQLENIKVQ
jgi:Family of unknown function (DUF5689)